MTMNGLQKFLKLFPRNEGPQNVSYTVDVSEDDKNL